MATNSAIQEQIKSWFDSRARRNKQRKHRLATPSNYSNEEEAYWHSIDERGDGMLLESDGGILLDSISKNITTPTSPAQTCNSQLPFQLKPDLAHSLARTAMQLIIGTRQTSQNMPHGVQIHKPTTTSLTTLCPVMFSPGFKKVVH